MKLSFRWYGPDDPVTLENIRQIPGMRGIVTAVYDVAVGEVWPLEKIRALKEKVEAHGMSISVIESVPVHEDIKLGLETRDRYIENYIKTLRNIGEAGIDTVCYNFMPVFDWTRSELDRKLADGSTALAYDHDRALRMDPVEGELDLPGWATDYSKEELRNLLDQYSDLSEEGLWNHLEYFLKQVVPAAEEAGVNLAIHPDDPPWPIFGLPRIITNKSSLERVTQIVDSPSNGLTVCSGSLGANKENDLPDIIRSFARKKRIHFLHLRNIRRISGSDFEETAHLSEYGSLDFYEMVKAAVDSGFEGPVRPDHGRMIWGEKGRPGYGLYDRALGATYIQGLVEAVRKERQDPARAGQI